MNGAPGGPCARGASGRYMGKSKRRDDKQGEPFMRVLLTALVISTGLVGLSGLAGCTSNPNAPGIQAMNPVNACGPGGTSDAEDCPSGRR